MRLSTFIRSEMEAILGQWEAFAAGLLPCKAMDTAALRDHARDILEAVATDIETSQTRTEQTEKSQGRAHAAANSHAEVTAAQTHARLRAQSGFDINETLAEYRALRASVLRLWKDAHPFSVDDFDDMLRFNEGIDQAIAESVMRFEEHVERARNLLLGMLGHDMRSPLASILSTAEYLDRLQAGGEVSVAANRLIRSGRSIKVLLDDLVDFNRTRLGLGIRIYPSKVDVAELVNDELEQIRAAHPARAIELVVTGDTLGHFDANRLQQLLRNLVANALAYGAKDSQITVSVAATSDEIVLRVLNLGEAIDPARVPLLFEPLVRAVSEGNSSSSSLGLGLFIVREIACAHGGQVAVRSKAGETAFTTTLPKSPRPTAAMDS